jgi:hypothetical protein
VPDTRESGLPPIGTDSILYQQVTPINANLNTEPEQCNDTPSGRNIRN